MEQKYATNELELLAVKWATEHFKHYLLGRHFTVGTDHEALVSVSSRHGAHKEYSWWQMRLLPFDFEVIYKPGSQMGFTDYLSRDPAFTAPPPKDESSLVIAIIKQLNINCHFSSSKQLLGSRLALLSKQTKTKEARRPATIPRLSGARGTLVKRKRNEQSQTFSSR